MGGPDEAYLAECGGVPAWEVALLVNPTPPTQPMSLEQTEVLLSMAERAFSEGNYWKAHTVAEQAYAGSRQLSTLLYLLDIRVNALGEVAFGAACYHSILRMLQLSRDERHTVEELHQEADRKMRDAREEEEAKQLFESRAAELRRRTINITPTAQRTGDSTARHVHLLPFEEHRHDEPLNSSLSSLRRPGGGELGGLPRRGTPLRRKYDLGEDVGIRPPPVHVPRTPRSASTYARASTPGYTHGVATPFGPRGAWEDDGEDNATFYGEDHPPATITPSSTYRGRVPHVPTRVAATFRAYDSNSSGRLDYMELRHAMRDCDLDVTTKTARQLVLAYDDNGDGKLDLSEFYELVRDVEAGFVRRPRHSRRGSSLLRDDEDERIELHQGLRSHYGNIGASALGDDFASVSARQQKPSSVTAVAEAMAAAPPAALLAVKRPLVSPLIAARRMSPSKRKGGGGRNGHDDDLLGDGLDMFGFLESGLSMPMLSSLFNQNRQSGFFSLEYEAQSGLEEWLESLPGLQPMRPPPLLGVRPLERAEAIARVLRCECTFWEAQRAYVDSHKLYLRQWIALELQALYRMHKAKREAHRRRHAGWEARMKQALGYWRNQTVTRCFVAWRMLVAKTHRAWASAEQAVVKMYNQGVSRAFNAWKARAAAYAKNKGRITEATRMMRDPVYRAYRVWARAAAARRVGRRPSSIVAGWPLSCPSSDGPSPTGTSTRRIFASSRDPAAR